MMLKELLRRVMNSKMYKKFNDDNKSYLCSFFRIEGDNNEDWQIDFYNPEKDRITSFREIGNQIKIISQDSKVFKEKDKQVNELKIDNVKISQDDAIRVVDDLKKEKCPDEDVLRKIFILQNTREFKDIWNITYLTSSFNIFNVKINAKNGVVLEDSLKAALSFSKAS